MTLPYTCGGCSARWSGYRTAHCTVCHITFAGPSNFDDHRRDGRCLPPATVGMQWTQRLGYVVWGYPMDQAGKDRLRALRD